VLSRLGGRVPGGKSACRSAFHIPARKTRFQPLSKGNDEYGLFDQIAPEIYVICTLSSEVFENETFQ
jgi:hypothetical protein